MLQVRAVVFSLTTHSGWGSHTLKKQSPMAELDPGVILCYLGSESEKVIKQSQNRPAASGCRVDRGHQTECLFGSAVCDLGAAHTTAAASRIVKSVALQG